MNGSRENLAARDSDSEARRQRQRLGLHGDRVRGTPSLHFNLNDGRYCERGCDGDGACGDAPLIVAPDVAGDRFPGALTRMGLAIHWSHIARGLIIIIMVIIVVGGAER